MGKNSNVTTYRWRHMGNSLCAEVPVSPTLLPFARDYALHRLRATRKHVRGFLHPIDIEITAKSITLQFVLDEFERREEQYSSFTYWRDCVLLPCLDTLVTTLSEGIVGFSPFTPIRGRWIPPVSWFLPRYPQDQPGNLCAEDLELAVYWIEREVTQFVPTLTPAERQWTDNLLATFRRYKINEIYRLLTAEVDSSRRRNRFHPQSVSFLSLLTEAEILERALFVLPYQLLKYEDATCRGLSLSGDEGVLEVDLSWQDSHFPSLRRPSPQEVWDALIDESRTTPRLRITKDIPNPLEQTSGESGLVRWLGVHVDQPYIFIQIRGMKIPHRGYLRLDNVGDDTLMTRKRKFSQFAGLHPELERILMSPPPPKPFEANPQSRLELEDVILRTRGVFPIQGPPGTGKTHLATQVVRRLLGQESGARVLICAKEHFALDHILKKVTKALEEDDIPYRAWRSVSQAKLRTGRNEIDSRWLPPTVTKGLAEYSWSPEAKDWSRWQASSSDQHDLRMATLGKQAANLFFCTTMDSAMVEFLDNDSFDLVIVEEAGKCYPSEILHALCLGRIVLVIGDHMQLPPYQEQSTREQLVAWQETLSNSIEDSRFRETMEARFGTLFKGLLDFTERHGPLSDVEISWLRPFEFLFDRLPGRHRLEEQFRMEAPLSRVVGKVFYGKPFIHRKQDLVNQGLIPPRPLGNVLPADLDVPLLWIDTPHMLDVHEATEDDGKLGVRDNRYEVEVICGYLRRLSGGPHIDMVILTPYNAQKGLLLDSKELRELCNTLTNTPFEQVVRTTDEYQGREAELTILSLVRNNSLGVRAWGFMTELERLNVMFSRARFRQVVVGCSDHIKRHSKEAEWLYKVWCEYQIEAKDPGCARFEPSKEFLDG